MKSRLLVSRGAPNVVDNSSESLGVAILGNNVLSDLWSVLDTSLGSIRCLGTGFL